VSFYAFCKTTPDVFGYVRSIVSLLTGVTGRVVPIGLLSNLVNHVQTAGHGTNTECRRSRWKCRPERHKN
jgi:hypothetical protein